MAVSMDANVPLGGDRCDEQRVARESCSMSCSPGDWRKGGRCDQFGCMKRYDVEQAREAVIVAAKAHALKWEETGWLDYPTLDALRGSVRALEEALER